MLVVAGVIVLGVQDPDPAPPPTADEEREALHVDDTSPESVVESFYDAWRRRRWPEALGIAVGRARQDVLDKQERDAALSHDERVVAERMWDALAHAPLSLELDEVEMLGDEHYRLRGVAEYQFVGQPYRRRVSFLAEMESEGHYRVTQMDLGEVLTELPDLFRGTNPEGS
jgi:hypothetical protein